MAFDWGTNVGQPVEDAIGRLDDYNSGIFNASTNPKGLKGGGHISNFPAALTDTAVVANGFATFADLMAAYATAAQTSATEAAGSADKLSGTSTSSVTLSTGNKSFATQTGRSWVPGNYLLITSNGNPSTDWMVLLVTGYTSTSLSGTAVAFSGSGSRADWTIRLTGVPGRTIGISYIWSTSTSASDPTAGRIRINNATPSAATAVYISETDADGNALGALLATWDDLTSSVKGRFAIRGVTQPANFALFDVIATITDFGTWDTFSVTAVASGGTLVDGMQVTVLFYPTGDMGVPGPSGPSYIATSTSSLTIGTGTKAFVTQTGLAYQAGTRMRATDAANIANYMEGIVTGYSGGTLTMTADLISGSGTIANWNINVTGERGPTGAGVAGPAGAAGVAGVAGPTTAPTWNFETTTTAGVTSAGGFRLNNASASSATALYVSDTGVGGADMNTFIDSWDVSTNTTHKASLFMTQANDPTKYAIFRIDSVTDSGAYWTAVIVYLGGPGGFAAGEECAFSVSISGNAGAGSGDVVGPASSTTDQVALYASGTGKQIKAGSLVGSAAFRTDIGLGNVDNTSDLNKPLSIATLTALLIKKVVSVRVATTASISVTADLQTGDTIDGVVLALADLVLVKSQSSSAENGIYTVSGSPTRHANFVSYTDFPGLQVTVQEGTVNADSIWLCTSNTGGTLGSSALTFTQYGGPSGPAGRAVLAAADTSAVQAGLGLAIGVNVQAFDALLTSIAGLTMATDRYIFGTGTDTVTLGTITAQGRALIDDATAGDQLTTLGFSGFGKSLIDDPNGGAALTTLGVSAAAQSILDDTSIPAILATLGIVGKQAIPCPAAGMVGTAADGNLVLTNQIFVTKNFDATTAESVYFSFRMPQQWNEGGLQWQFVWSHAPTTTNFGVVFELSACAVGDNEAGDPAYVVGTALFDTGGTTNNIYISPEGILNVSGAPQAGDYVMFRLRRTPTAALDNLAVDARIHEVTVYMTTDTGIDV